jgi:hypothetical protein
MLNQKFAQVSTNRSRLPSEHFTKTRFSAVEAQFLAVGRLSGVDVYARNHC